MRLKCDKLDWVVDMTGERIVASMFFENFEQSSRFVEMLMKFILAERKQPEILEEIAWYCPPALLKNET